jgi:hypothetical protein
MLHGHLEIRVPGQAWFSPYGNGKAADHDGIDTGFTEFFLQVT